MYSWIQGFLLVVIISLGAAERRWCQPSRYDVTITSDGWVEYDDVTFACVTCGNTSQTRLINRRRLSNYECCNGQLVARGNCDVIPSLPGGTCSIGEKCDGVKQCVDGSDELNCRECNGTNKFSCNESHDTDPCVGVNQVCDGRKDCEMGLDETGCNWYGGQCDGFLCGGLHPRCIPLSQVCDGTKQCMDGSDEHNCRYCLMQFRCSVFLRADPKDPGVNTTTAECIGSFRVCDGRQDCLNGLDESNCYRWKDWATWSECGNPVACQRTRTRDCLNKAGNIVEAHHCHHVEDYHHKDGSPGGQNQTEICPECITTTTTTISTTTTKSETTTVLAPTTFNLTKTETYLSTTDTTAYEGSSSENDNVSVTSYTTQAVNQNTSQSNIMTSSYEKSTVFDAVTKSDLNTSNGSTYAVTDAGIPTHQPRASGLSLPLVIALISIAVLFVIILIVACIFCCTERRRKTGKWIPRRRYHEREPVRVSQMYYDVSLDGVEESINRIDSNPNLKPCALDTFSAVTAPSAVDSGIDENHSTTSTRRSNHSPSLSITSSQSSQSEGFPAPPSPLTNQNTSV